MTEIITYRLSSAGAWGYEFYDAGRNRIGSVSTDVMPSSPTLIKGEGIDWYSTFSMEHTIVPGTGRWVKNNQNGLEVYRIIFWKQGMYQVRTADNCSVQVEIREGDYLFGKPEMPVTAMSKRIQDADWRPDYRNIDVAPYFRTIFYEDVSEAYRMMVLSFPALRFY